MDATLSYSPYVGLPNAAIDNAWDRITEGMEQNTWIVTSQTQLKYELVSPIIINEDTLRQINTSKHSVKVPKGDGEGYMAHLGVTHQLHCLVRCFSHSTPKANSLLAEPVGFFL